jgi:hypothetical protein
MIYPNSLLILQMYRLSIPEIGGYKPEMQSTASPICIHPIQVYHLGWSFSFRLGCNHYGTLIRSDFLVGRR